MKPHHITTEDELRQYEANVKKIKVGGKSWQPEPVASLSGKLMPPSPKSLYRSKGDAAFAHKLGLEEQAHRREMLQVGILLGNPMDQYGQDRGREPKEKEGIGEA